MQATFPKARIPRPAHDHFHHDSPARSAARPAGAGCRYRGEPTCDQTRDQKRTKPRRAGIPGPTRSDLDDGGEPPPSPARRPPIRTAPSRSSHHPVPVAEPSRLQPWCRPGGAAPPPLMAPKCHRRAAAFSGVRAFLVSRHRAKKLLPRRVASMLLNAKITKAAAIVAPVVFGVPQVDERHGCATEDRVREGSCLLEESKTQTQKSKPGRIHWSISSYRPVPLESPRPVTGPQSGTRRPTPATPDGNDPACRCARPTVRSPLAAITG